MSDELYAKLHTLTPLDLKQLSRQQKLELIQRHRASGARNSNAILFLSTDLLAGGARGLSSSELYDVYEQTLIASLDCGKLDNAKTYLNLLEKRFGRKSVRVNYVRGLCLEAEGKYAEAKVLYEEHVRSEAPTDAFTVKRLAAMLKSEGKYKEAIHVLESEKHYTDAEGAKYSYLDIHRSNSTDVYHELSALYFLCGDVPKAMYYEEEALLFDIDNYVLHNRLGELAFISKDLHRSTVEYSQSLLLNPAENNSRAAYGLWLSANESLRAHASGTLKYDDERDLTQMQELREFAAQTLKRMYAGSTMTADLESFLSGEVAASKK